MRTKAECLAEGMIINESAGGRPCAYVGPTFNPTRWEPVLTDLEETMLGALKAVQNNTDDCLSLVDDAIEKAAEKMP